MKEIFPKVSVNNNKQVRYLTIKTGQNFNKPLPPSTPNSY